MISRIEWTFVVASFFFYACSNEAARPEEETVEPTEQIAAEAENSELQSSFPQFFTYLSTQDTSFSIQNFEQNESMAMDSTKAFPVDEKQLQPFSDYLIYNTDSSLAIDLYSYNYIPVRRNGRTVLEQGGPDTEIAVIDTKDSTRRRIFFSGPGVSIQQAKWQDKNTVFLAGVEEVSENALKPILWKINIPHKTVQIINYMDTLQGNMRDFLPEHLPGKIIKSL
jgi:hypothetical protein